MERDKVKYKLSNAKVVITHHQKIMPNQSLSNSSFDKTLPSQFYCWVCCYVVWKILLDSSDQLSQLHPLPVSCPPSAHGLREQSHKREKVLVPWKPGSARATPLVYYQHCFATNLKHGTTWAAMEKNCSISARATTGKEKYGCEEKCVNIMDM